MKKLLLLLSLFTYTIGINAQDLRCIYSMSYKVESSAGEKLVKSPCAVCYYGNYFSFYTGETGTRTFEITAKTNDNTKKIGRESFINEENETNNIGDYSVEVNYGVKKKTFVISLTKFGIAYVIESNAFLGSPTANKKTDLLIQKISDTKEKDKLIVKAHSDINLQNYFSDNFNFNEQQKLKRDLGVFKGVLNISKNGKVTSVEFSDGTRFNPINESDGVFENKIVKVFMNMPSWQPYLNSDKISKDSRVSIVVNIVSNP